MPEIRLFTYFRSSAAFRVRIALNLKGVAHELVPVHLLRAEQNQAGFLRRNPQGLVPVLQHGDITISQSLAIIEYLDELFPDPPLLPPTAHGRAAARALAMAIACEIHPLNNLRVLEFLRSEMDMQEVDRLRWYRHWVETGLQAMEHTLAGQEPSPYCHGEQPGLADCCLVPQIFNAQRFQCNLGRLPRIMEIFERCMGLDAFQRAQPASQPSFETPT